MCTSSSSETNAAARGEEEKTPAPVEDEVSEKEEEATTSVSETEEGETDSEEEAKEESETHSEEEETRNICPGLGVELGNGGLILVLFETPSGFAIFSYDGVKLRLPRAIENIWADFIEGDSAKRIVWFEEFQTFENKTRAINLVTGVNEQLTTMIQKHIEPGQKIAVGKLEYKDIIEDKLGISCLFDDTVMELMWGLKNCMQYLVPGEKSELTKEDRLHMSEGMKIVLRKYKFEVEPEMVNKLIIEKTGILYSCDVCVNKHSKSMRAAGEHLKKISGIDSQHWGLAKLVTALKILCYPDEGLPGDPRPVFSRDEFLKLVHHGPLYEGKILKVPCKIAFDQMVSARCLRNKTLPLLTHYVWEAREAYQADQALMNSS